MASIDLGTMWCSVWTNGSFGASTFSFANAFFVAVPFQSCGARWIAAVGEAGVALLSPSHRLTAALPAMRCSAGSPPAAGMGEQWAAGSGDLVPDIPS
ncbi:hypothetical protein GCM10010464_03540 [Pseudonocardia yunnanensis]